MSSGRDPIERLQSADGLDQELAVSASTSPLAAPVGAGKRQDAAAVAIVAEQQPGPRGLGGF